MQVSVTMQKDSGYLPDLECYAEIICTFARFGVMGGNLLSKKKLAGLTQRPCTTFLEGSL